MKYLEEFIKAAVEGGKEAALKYVKELPYDEVVSALRHYGAEPPEDWDWAADRLFYVLRRKAIERDRTLVNRLI